MTVPLPLVAQAPPRAPEISLAGPRAEFAQVGLRPSVGALVRHPGAPLQRRAVSRAKPTTLMIVGGAAFIGGLLIGDAAGTAIAVAGLGVGLYGLYLYLQ